MNIVLKNIKFYESMSEETNCFQANIYIDGKHRGYAKNDGRGGNTEIRTEYNSDEVIFAVNKEAMAKAEEYCKTLPPVKMFGKEFPQDLESVVDELLDNYVNEKADKKFLKDMEKGILVGSKNAYAMTYWKNTTLEAMLKNPNGVATIKALCLKYKSEGKTILNTNIPKEVLN